MSVDLKTYVLWVTQLLSERRCAFNRLMVVRGKGVRGLDRKGEGMERYRWVVTK